MITQKTENGNDLSTGQQIDEAQLLADELVDTYGDFLKDITALN